MTGIPPGSGLSKIPLLPHPDGRPSNLINPTSKTTTVLAVGIGMIVISTLCLAVRLITNLNYIKKLKIDDSRFERDVHSHGFNFVEQCSVS